MLNHLITHGKHRRDARQRNVIKRCVVIISEFPYLTIFESRLESPGKQHNSAKPMIKLISPSALRLHLTKCLNNLNKFPMLGGQQCHQRMLDPFLGQQAWLWLCCALDTLLGFRHQVQTSRTDIGL